MKNETTLPSVPAGFTADSWPLFVVNGLRCRHELGLADDQDLLAATCSQALEAVIGTGALIWCAMVPDGTKMVGSTVDSDNDERPFVLTNMNGTWKADITVAECKMPRGFKTALKAVTAQPARSAACTNPNYVPVVLAHYGVA